MQSNKNQLPTQKETCRASCPTSSKERPKWKYLGKSPLEAPVVEAEKRKGDKLAPAASSSETQRKKGPEGRREEKKDQWTKESI